jgi:tetratricopeptide (TPR) repeat protein
MEDELSFNEAVTVLCDYGLIEVDNSSKGQVVESQGYSMHSCVHAWTVHVVNQEWDVDMAEVAMECIGRHVPENNAQHSWLTQRRLLRHLARCWGFIVNGRLDEDGKDWILYNFGYVCSNQGQFDKAEKMYLRALQGKEKAWGPDHTSTLNTVHNLGNLYASLGRLDEAENTYLRALQGKEKAWGPDHTSTLDTVNNLGVLHASLGRLEAEKMYLRALQGYEKALSQEAVKTYIPVLNTAENMAALFQQTSRTQEAKLLYEQALLGIEAVFGRTSNRYRSVAKILDRLCGASEHDT